MNKIYSTVLLFLLCIFKSEAQKDSTRILTIDDFIEKIKLHHPLAKVARIQEEKAGANLLSAKGAFDPVFEYETRQKTFDSKNYYFYNNADLKVPLPVGDIKTGLERNGGQFLESEITPGRSSFLGVEVPLAKGLMIDKRRAFLQQAKIAVQQTAAQRKALLNDLLLDAYNSYYQWSGSYKLYHIFSSYVKISNDRLKLVVTSNINGDRAVMDTTEAYTQLQNFLLMQADAEIKMMSAKFDINNFIWGADGLAQNIADGILPDTTLIGSNITTKALNDLLQISNAQNPILQQSRFKIDGLQVDKKLKFQNLLPTVNLKANVLSKDYFVVKNFSSTLLDNNNRWGIDIKIPLRFREGRGEYRLAKLKIQESTLELNQKMQETDNKIKDYYNQFNLLQSQLNVASSALKNYNALLRNELLRFTNGESSLFLVNTRENKLLEIQQKIIELQVKLLKAKYGLDWAAGLLQ